MFRKDLQDETGGNVSHRGTKITERTTEAFALNSVGPVAP